MSKYRVEIMQAQFKDRNIKGQFHFSRIKFEQVVSDSGLQSCKGWCDSSTGFQSKEEGRMTKFGSMMSSDKPARAGQSKLPTSGSCVRQDTANPIKELARKLDSQVFVLIFLREQHRQSNGFVLTC